MCIRDSCKLDQLTNDFNEQKIKCEQQNIQNEINFKEIKEQNIQFQQNINIKFNNLSHVLDKHVDERFENIKLQLTESMNCLLYTSRCV